MASNVVNRIALALSHLSLDKFANEIPVLSESSVSDIWRCTSIRSMLILILGFIYSPIKSLNHIDNNDINIVYQHI